MVAEAAQRNGIIAAPTGGTERVAVVDHHRFGRKGPTGISPQFVGEVQPPVVARPGEMDWVAVGTENPKEVAARETGRCDAIDQCQMGVGSKKRGEVCVTSGGRIDPCQGHFPNLRLGGGIGCRAVTRGGEEFDTNASRDDRSKEGAQGHE